jgi:hypothetical protein
MITEKVKLFGVGRFTHTRYNGFYQIGETDYNCQVRRKPVRKFGKAPCVLLNLYPFWFTMERAQNDLRALGFEKVNELEWERVYEI